MKYITDISVDNLSGFDRNSIRAEYSDAEKKMVLNYLNRFQPSLFTSAPVVDVFTGEKVADADNGYSDGKYTWFVSEIYYFKEYTIPLTDDFIDHVKKTA